MTAPGGEVVLSITGRDIWEKLDKIETAVSGLPARVDDHEARLRVLEERRTVSPAQLWTVTASGVGALGVVVTLVQKIIT